MQNKAFIPDFSIEKVHEKNPGYPAKQLKTPSGFFAAALRANFAPLLSCESKKGGAKFGFRREFSAGGIVYRMDGNTVKIALIEKNRTGCPKPCKAVWCLPKGKIEKGETSQEAAKREIQEETGLTARLIKRLGDISYWFVSPQDKARVFKRVRFFLFEYAAGAIGASNREVSQAKWFTIKDALKLMSYPSERKTARIALREIQA